MGLFKSKNGFTLAEVLITLGIIGVVAALTIPTLISEYKERAYVESFKKAYTEIFQAYKLSVMENGTADNWATEQDIYNNMKPYFKVAQDCPMTVGCFAPVYTGLKGTTTVSSYYNSIDYKFVTNSGYSLLFQIDSGHNSRLIYVDTNGLKPPNKFGYDLFILGIDLKNEAPIITRPFDDSWPGSRYCSMTQDASGWLDGGACSRYMLKHWNMDYLHRDISSEW